jgi:glycosyltransferase involved in cell wall biosynthesis
MERDSRIILISTPNQGVARARNLGLETASGDFVAFLDADDLWHPEKIGRQVQCMLDSPEPIAACYVLTRSINLIDEVTADNPALIVEGYCLVRLISTWPVGNGSCLMVRREIAREIGGYDPTYAERQIGGCEDIDFEWRLAARHPIGVVPLYLVGYRRYKGSMSSDRGRMARAALATVKAHLHANPNIPRKLRRLALGKVYEFCFWNHGGERQIVASVLAACKLTITDPLRAVNLYRCLIQRALLCLGRLGRISALDATSARAFLDLSTGPLTETTKCFDHRRLPDLAQADADLRSALQQQFSKNSSPTM